MKRLFGLAGFTFLFVLAAVFYSAQNKIIFAVIGFVSILSLGIGIIMILSRREKYNFLGKSLCMFCAAAIFAMTNLIFYTNYAYNPVVDNYADKEISFSGYVCDEIINGDSFSSYTVKTDTVNGKAENIKIKISSYSNTPVEPFDRVNIKAHTYKNDSNSQISHRIYLKAFTSSDFKIEITGEKEKSLYSAMVSLRGAMKNSLDELLPTDYSNLCKAVLLGDKRSLGNSVVSDFSMTGTSFLIVVSGLHLVVVTSFLLFFVRKITKNKYILCAVTIAAVLLFMALTGFAYSVIRAGIMMIVASLAMPNMRRADSLNSLGIAAVVITVINPLAVADIGMLLSFSATAGIILWSYPIEKYLLNLFRFENIRQNGIKGFIVYYLKHCFYFFINLFSVSLSAFLWVFPITAIAFKTITPFVMFISLVAEPLVSIILVFALISAVLYLCPIISFAAYPFAFVAGICAKIVLSLVSVCSKLPFGTLHTEDDYRYIWIFMYLLFVIGGIFVKKRKFYIKISAAVLLCTLCILSSVTAYINSKKAVFTVHNVGIGMFATVKCGNNASVLSCGGSKSKAEDILTELEKNCDCIDYLIIPNAKNNYSSLQPFLYDTFDLNNILVYDNGTDSKNLMAETKHKSRHSFGCDVSFTINLSNSVKDEVISTDNTVFQYISGKSLSVLLVPYRADISHLPEKYRNPDCVLLDSVPKNGDLLTCSYALFSGSKGRYNRYYNSLKELCTNIYTSSDGDFSIDLNGG